MSPTASPTVDIHTHIYPPSYLSLLSSRTTPPQLLNLPRPSPSLPAPPPRLIILPSDTPASNPSTPPSHLGRPIGPEYSSVPHILSFMTTHRISISILSLANPWLDFLPASDSAAWARRINTELCTISAASSGRLYAFGVLPLTAPLPAILSEISFLTTDPRCKQYIKGIILGTTGLGAGLDDPALHPIFAALASPNSQLLIFIHPHYGLPASVFGPRAHDSGHVLPLSLGFPLETTIAFTRLWLSGTFDAFPGLRVLLAHAGGAVPALAGRGGGGRVRGPKRGMEEVLRENVFLDAVSYSATATKAAVEMVGKGRVLFGTDHPFFPPVGGRARGQEADGAEEGQRKEGSAGEIEQAVEEEEQEEWTSVRTNVEAVKGALGDDEEGIRGVLGGNAVRLFGLDVDALGEGGGEI
ncbi:hypothetical protein G7Y79_00044g080220 [Physcia stellaris]|nr:hypothetical protein G7Y79_00044g080220 [Physcia stellaris]